MKIVPLKKSHTQYSCNSYLILGAWNRIGDVNTLIDPGSDDSILDQIAQVSTGVGKRGVEQIILTHNHFDHSTAVQAVKERYHARVLAWHDGPLVDEALRDGQLLTAGDDVLEVIHTPGHSSDSICLYAAALRALFSGDTMLKVTGVGEMFTQDYLDGLVKLASRRIEAIYAGHDEPMIKGCHELILRTLSNVRNSKIL